MRVFAAIFGAALAFPAVAQDAPLGIGFAAAEEGVRFCRHHESGEALACARELCAEGAPDQECLAIAWCYPARWSGVMTIWLPDFHSAHALCGAPSERALKEALAEFCAASSEATGCDLSVVIDPDGNETTVEGVSFPGGAAPQTSEEASGEMAPENGDPTD
jgi:hypothetical protein